MEVLGERKQGRRSILRPRMLYYRRFQNVSREIRIKGVFIMRKVVAGLFMTLDGVVESPGTWQEPFDEGMGAAMMEQLTSQYAVLLGRVTYQQSAPYWPTATDEPFASFINSTSKHAFSTT